MTHLRLFVIVLLVLNGMAALGLSGWLGSPGRQGEPERLTNQLYPERIERMSLPLAQVRPQLHPQGDGAALPAQDSSGAQADSAAEPREAEAPEPAPVHTPAPPACVAFAGLAPDQARSLLAAVQKNPGVKARDVASEVPQSWWVNLPPQGSKEAAEIRVGEIRGQGVTDLFIVQEAGPNQYGISLGLFKVEGQAQRQLELLRAKGVKGVRVTPRTSLSHRVELRGPADQLPELASEWASRFRGVSRLGCQP